MAPGLKYLFIDCIRSSHHDIIISTHAPGPAAMTRAPALQSIHCCKGHTEGPYAP